MDLGRGVIFAGVLLAYCAAYLLGRTACGNGRWCGVFGWMVVMSPMGMVGYVAMGAVCGSDAARVMFGAAGLLLIVGAAVWAASKPRAARVGAFAFSMCAGFILPSACWVRFLNADLPAGGIDNASAHYASTLMVGIVGVATAVAGWRTRLEG